MSLEEPLLRCSNSNAFSNCQDDAVSLLSDEISHLNINSISFSVPEFSCHQNQEELIFVLKEKHLEKNSFRIDYGLDQPSNNCCIRCSSKAKETISSNAEDYSLFIKLLPECVVIPGKETVTFSEMNAVIILKKHEESQHHWEFFYFGTNLNNAINQEMLTISALQHRLDILQKEASRYIESCQEETNVKVSANLIEDDHLEITFVDDQTTKSAKLNDNPGDENNSVGASERISSTSDYHEDSLDTSTDAGTNGPQLNESSSSVNSSRGFPFRRFRSVSECSGTIVLKGILKNSRRRTHTLSESSDDISWSSLDYTGFDSDIPEENYSNDISQTKKSVHFNDNVYRSFFRSNSSILGQREKNRRKQRKKQELRRRRSSSEGDSSGIEADENSSTSSKCAKEMTLDINQNQSSVEMGVSFDNNEWLDNQNAATTPQNSAVIDGDMITNNLQPKKDDRKKKRKKKGNLTSQNGNNFVQNDNQNLDLLNDPASSSSSQYPRHRRYFSRKRQTSI